ncbi:hypothetical protein WT15_19845 [Burkholderia stagnalis]|nr:hypothetical protein WT15_19845 [Burkholderia stagnalis]KWO26497.1 hypothetical protein WT96_32410 [Burkholderia stagnalis]KWO34123.1 hypothetical protein WT95_12330 [Burkholderia stagnalis]
MIGDMAFDERRAECRTVVADGRKHLRQIEFRILVQSPQDNLAMYLAGKAAKHPCPFDAGGDDPYRLGDC